MYLKKKRTESVDKKHTRSTKAHERKREGVRRERKRKRTKKFSEEERAHLLLKVGQYGTLLMGTHDTAAGWQVTGPMLIGRGYGRVAVVIRLLIG